MTKQTERTYLMRYVIAAFMLLSASAFAEDTPKPSAKTYDMTAAIPGVTDASTGVTKPIPDINLATKEDPGCQNCKSLTYGAPIVSALMLPQPGDDPGPDARGLPQKMTERQTSDYMARLKTALYLQGNAAAVLNDEERIVICARVKQRQFGLPTLRVVEYVCPGDPDIAADRHLKP